MVKSTAVKQNGVEIGVRICYDDTCGRRHDFKMSIRKSPLCDPESVFDPHILH